MPSTYSRIVSQWKGRAPGQTDAEAAAAGATPVTASFLNAVEDRIVALSTDIVALDGRPLLTPKDAPWTAGTAYKVGDLVTTAAGSTFRVKTAHTSGTTAPTVTTPGANYTVFAAAGAVGAPGTATAATVSAIGAVQLAGDLAGTATAPTVPALADLRAAITALGGSGGSAAVVPAPYTDAFNRANQAGIGNGWTINNGSDNAVFSIENNAVRLNTTVPTYNYTHTAQPAASTWPTTIDRFAAMDVTAPGDAPNPQPQVMLNSRIVNGSAVGYFARWGGTGDGGANVWQLYRADASGGVLMKSSTTPALPGYPYRIRLERRGGVLTVLVNGTQVMTATDPSPLTDGGPAIGMRYTQKAVDLNQRVDNWEHGSLSAVTPPAPSALVEYTTASAVRPNAIRVTWVWRGTGTPVDPTAAIFPDEIVTPA